MSIQTNSLPFIMHTEDDFNSEAVRQKLRDAFHAISTKQLRKQPNIGLQVFEMLGSDSEKAFKTLYFMNQILPILSDFGLNEFDRQFKQVKEAIEARQDTKDVMWKDMVWHFIYTQEHKQVTAYLAEHNLQLSKADLREGKVDLRCVESFRDIVQQNPMTSFAEFHSQDAGRIELYFKAQFNNFINKEALKASEAVLPEGFKKMCGLKGGKLSGG